MHVAEPQSMRLRSVAAVLAVGGAIVLSCSNDGGRDGPFATGGSSGAAAGGTPSGGAPAANVGAFSPAEIASILLVLDIGEVERGQLALRRSPSRAVVDFAQRVVTEHSQAAQRLQAIPGLGAVSADDTTAALLARQDRVLTQDLQQQTAAGFELAYVTTEIATHAKLLGLIDYVLEPALVAASTGADAGAAVSQDAGPTSGAGGVADAGRDAGALEVADAAAAADSGDLVIAAVAQAQVEESSAAISALFTEVGTTRTAGVQHLAEAVHIQQQLPTP